MADESDEQPNSDDLMTAGDVDLRPGRNSDPQDEIDKYISEDIRKFYDVYSYGHAATILATSFPDELADLKESLLNFRITKREIGMPGGNESDMPKKFSHTLRPRGWVEARIQGDLTVRMQEYGEEILEGGKTRKFKVKDQEARYIENFIDGHKIDYVKGRVAFDLEWNSKDQTFDRDLYAMRVFHECGLLSLGVMVTRSEKLNPVFDVVPKLNKDGEVVMSGGAPVMSKGKYGASTTWMGKLLYRLNAGRHGGCPILVFGITPELIEDWNQNA